MQEKIHPNYGQTTITCACGNVIETGSTKKDIRVEICSKCHPFFTSAIRSLPVNRSLLIQAAVLTVSRSASVWRNNETELKAVHLYRLT